MSANGSDEADRSSAAGAASTGGRAVTSHRAGDGVGRARWLALLGGLLAGLAAFGIGEAAYRRIPAQKVTFDTLGGPVTAATGETIAVADKQNAALAFGVLGLCLGGCLGIAGGLARRAAGAGVGAGLLGSILGAALSSGALVVSLPYLANLQKFDPDYEIFASMAMHSLPWGLAGASAGLAFAVGLGRPRLLGLAAMAGVVGAVLGTIAFDLIGAALFPFAGASEPVSTTWSTRLLARLLVAVGTAVAVILILPGPTPARAARRSEMTVTPP